MKKFIENIYYTSPVAIQNILVTLYGAFLYKQRYHKKSQSFLCDLKRTGTFKKDEIVKLQNKLFSDIARHALTTVPYYVHFAERNKIHPNDINTLDDLKIFPVLSKDEVRANSKQFLSKTYRLKRNYFVLNTSGTTGSPLSVYCDDISRSKHYSFFSRLRNWYGIGNRSRRATFFGRIILLPEHNQPPFWRYDLFQNNLLMSSYHLAKENLQYYYQKLRSYKPEEIIGYPSSLYQLAKYIVDSNLNPLKPQLTICTAENLMEYQKEIIEKAFAAPVINQYGCTEMAFFAASCKHGTMHIHPEHGFVETLDNNRNNIIGSPGKLVATGFINKTMPLIRYEIGDLVTLHENFNCACGSHFPSIKNIEGRIDDILYRKDGTPIGRLDPVFKGGSRIVAAQIHQKQTGDVEVLLVPEPQFNTDNKRWLLQEFQKRLGNDIQISIILVDEIPKEKNGKFRAVIGNYKPRG